MKEYIKKNSYKILFFLSIFVFSIIITYLSYKSGKVSNIDETKLSNNNNLSEQQASLIEIDNGSTEKLEKDKKAFTEAVKEFSSKNALAIILNLKLDYKGSEYDEYATKMVSPEQDSSEKYNYAKKLLGFDKSQFEQYEKLVQFDSFEPLNKLYEVSSAISDDTFRNDALNFVNISKVLDLKQKQLLDATIRLRKLESDTAETIIKDYEGIDINLSLLPSRNEMETIMENRISEQSKTREMFDNFRNKYSILKGKYQLDDLNYDE